MKLDIGGEKHKHHHNTCGWTIVDINPNSDVICTVGDDQLPFDDNSIDAIYTSHTLEHILPHTQEKAYKDMYRVLKTGALIRIVVPDIDIAIKHYIAGNSSWFRQKHQPTKVPSLPTSINLSYLSGYFFTYDQKYSSNKNKIANGGHVTPYNFDMVKYYLIFAGFNNIKRMSFLDCSSIFDGLDFDMCKDFSVYVEAIK